MVRSSCRQKSKQLRGGSINDDEQWKKIVEETNKALKGKEWGLLSTDSYGSLSTEGSVNSKLLLTKDDIESLKTKYVNVTDIDDEQVKNAITNILISKSGEAERDKIEKIVSELHFGTWNNNLNTKSDKDDHPSAKDSLSRYTSIGSLTGHPSTIGSLSGRSSEMGNSIYDINWPKLTDGNTPPITSFDFGPGSRISQLITSTASLANITMYKLSKDLSVSDFYNPADVFPYKTLKDKKEYVEAKNHIKNILNELSSQHEGVVEYILDYVEDKSTGLKEYIKYVTKVTILFSRVYVCIMVSEINSTSTSSASAMSELQQRVDTLKEVSRDIVPFLLKLEDEKITID